MLLFILPGRIEQRRHMAHSIRTQAKEPRSDKQTSKQTGKQTYGGQKASKKTNKQAS